MGYRFHFYGRRPADWYEGANMGHSYEVAFRSTAKPAQKRALARLAEERFAEGPCELSSDPWLWSDHVASFTVGERWLNTTTMVFSRVTDFLVAVHDIAPIDQALFFGVREEGHGGWDRWTRADRPTPHPGPAYDPSRIRPFGRPVDPNLPVAAPDDDFEAARAEARQAISKREAAARTAQALAVCTKSGLKLIPHDGPAPTAASIEDPRFGDPPEGCTLHICPGPPRFAKVMSASKQNVGLLLLDEAGSPHRVEGIEGYTVAVAQSLDGARIITAGETTYKAGVWRVQRVTEDYTIEPLWRSEEQIAGLGALPDGNWLVATDKKMVVLEEKQDGPTVIASTPFSGYPVVVAHGGLCIASTKWPHLDVHGYASGKLRKLGRLSKVKVGELGVDEGQVVCKVADRSLRLEGFDEAYNAWAEPLRKKEEAKRAKARKRPATKATKLALEPTDAPVTESRDCLWPHEVTEDDFAEAFAALDSPRLFKSLRSQRVVAIDDRDSNASKSASVAWIGHDGKLETHRLGTAVFRHWVSFSPDGSSVMALNSSGLEMLLIDLSTDEVERLSLPGAPEEYQAGALYKVDNLLVLDKDRLVGTFKSGVVLWSRTKKGWRDCQVKLSKCKALYFCPALDLVAVRSEATKSRLVLYAIAEKQLVKLGAFAERITAVEVGDREVRVKTFEGDRFLVQNLEAIAEKKRAALAKKAKKAKAKKGK